VQNFGQIGLYLEVAPFDDFFAIVWNCQKYRVILNVQSGIILTNEQPSYTIYWSVIALSECIESNEF